MAHSCVTQRASGIQPLRHFLEFSWLATMDWLIFGEIFYPLSVYCCYEWFFILNTPFFRLLSLRLGGCSFAGFFSFSKHAFLLIWSASLLGLQSWEWLMSHAAVLLPTSHCQMQGLLLTRHLFNGLQNPDILCRPDRNDAYWFLLLGMLWTVNTHDFSNLWSFF